MRCPRKVTYERIQAVCFCVVNLNRCHITIYMTRVWHIVRRNKKRGGQVLSWLEHQCVYQVVRFCIDMYIRLFPKSSANIETSISKRLVEFHSRFEQCASRFCTMAVLFDYKVTHEVNNRLGSIGKRNVSGGQMVTLRKQFNDFFFWTV